MANTRYTVEFKKNIVKKLCVPGAPSANYYSKEIGIAQSTLSRWIREYGVVSMSKNITAKELSLREKHKLLLEYTGLSESEQGAFLRTKGLKTQDIENFQHDVENALLGAPSSPKRGRPVQSPEVKKLQKQLKHSKKELRRKDKALSEAAARIFLLKKSHEIFGIADEEDE